MDVGALQGASHIRTPQENDLENLTSGYLFVVDFKVISMIVLLNFCSSSLKNGQDSIYLEKYVDSNLWIMNVSVDSCFTAFYAVSYGI
ncbi:hypothetical protein AYI68_g2882 [Smittium mucronatum]|uniref:Uncharacterized protein n=1 Tax=Smittium mucronatum TaxID=133383 RepID=A0A1R0H1H2_9FUNG|nr:hypothetical protein AYI68_g2882 [Smittium mucronatum]